MQLYRNWTYIDTQKTGEEIKRFDLRKPKDVNYLQEKTKEGLKLAMMNPGEIVDDELMSVVYY
jgi:hypothetical protein